MKSIINTHASGLGITNQEIFRFVSRNGLFVKFLDRQWSFTYKNDYQEIARFTPSTNKLRITCLKKGGDIVIQSRNWKDAVQTINQVMKKIPPKKR